MGRYFYIGDTYYKRSLAGIPGRVEAAAEDDGWFLRNRIIWAKEGGMPEPAKNRLANRHEYILHLTPTQDYYYDINGYAEVFGNGAKHLQAEVLQHVRYRARRRPCCCGAFSLPGRK